MSDVMTFEEERVKAAPADDELVVDLEGYEGPIDVLLTLAREQKVDLTKISILALADQYLAFIAAARRLRLELAADYLVMAAWLAYLKSRLLLPVPPGPEEPSGEELAAALTHQLLRLEAMRERGVRLMALPRLDRDVFARGAPEGLPRKLLPRYEATLLDLLRAYGDQRRRKEGAVLHIVPAELYSMDDALDRLRRILGHMPEWRSLASFLPPGLANGLIGRSAIAATFAASLELARTGKLELRQDRAFGPILLRSPPGVA
ncbi:MAG TPA: ScpA family protein [Stellaceae bacterium]|jgi:segregation and condensation protein A|nr:ScpA family protein [Stellaceae bacterium]